MPSSTSPDPAADSAPDLAEQLGPELASALAKKGYRSLTPVQLSVLDPALAGHDLRVSSQTGSGKTLAIGFALRTAVAGPSQVNAARVGRPRALVIVPTRELAQQVHDELGWLYAPLKVKIAAVTGGSSYRDENRALAADPAIVVGTPGRLFDHLSRGSIEASAVRAVVLDEADRMLDLGFRDELESILKLTPEDRLTHLVSATFSREVKALADRFQKNSRRVEGTPLGSANTDIEHVVYLVPPAERVDALVNVLLHHPDDQTLIFARTRADVADITRELQQSGFLAGALSGEMEQTARNKALAAFKRGDFRALVATDVAARGIDVQDITRVVQVDPPNDPDTYTHRSGRTGRAGRKGTSALIVPPQALRRTVALLDRVKVRYRIQPVPTAEAIRTAQDERWLAELTESNTEVPERIGTQVTRIIERGLTERALGLLLLSRHKSAGEPRPVTALLPHDRGARPPPRSGVAGRDSFERDFSGPGRGRGGAPARDERSSYGPDARGDRAPLPARDGSGLDDARGPRSERASFGAPGANANGGGDWVPFRVSWGEAQGADARRLVAMLCRRGQIQSSDIGAIRVTRASSTVEVAGRVAERFAAATREPDARDPRVLVTPLGREPSPSFHERAEAPRRERGPSKPHAASVREGREDVEAAEDVALEPLRLPMPARVVAERAALAPAPHVAPRKGHAAVRAQRTAEVPVTRVVRRVASEAGPAPRAGGPAPSTFGKTRPSFHAASRARPPNPFGASREKATRGAAPGGGVPPKRRPKDK